MEIGVKEFTQSKIQPSFRTDLMNEILQALEYRLTPQGTWCRRYSAFAENMILISHPRNQPAIKKPYSVLDEIYIDQVTADYATQISTCKGLSECLEKLLVTRCIVALKIENGIVTRLLLNDGKVVREDRFSYKEFHDMAMDEMIFFPKIPLIPNWYENKNVLFGIIIFIVFLFYVLA